MKNGVNKKKTLNETLDIAAAYGDSWLLRLALNLLGYGSVLIPGYNLITYYKRIRYDEQRRGKRMISCWHIIQKAR